MRALFDHWGSREVEAVSLSDGRATISLVSMKSVEWAGTSCGSIGFMGSLLKTVFHFDTVESVQVQLAGSCKEFAEYMQGSECQTYKREHPLSRRRMKST